MARTAIAATGKVELVVLPAEALVEDGTTWIPVVVTTGQVLVVEAEVPEAEAVAEPDVALAAALETALVAEATAEVAAAAIRRQR